ncbi:GAF domain-containing protein [Anaerolineae bacterium CFX9]|nr:GAF domain-containing protein [Anaerolineae bacterium CFX9]
MQTLLSRIFSVDNFHSLILRERARVLYTTVVVLMVLFTLFATVPGQLDGSSLFGSFGTDASATISILSAYGFGGLTLIANRRGSWLWSGIGILLTWFGVAIVIAWRNGFVLPGHGMSMAIFLIFATLFLNLRGVIAATAIALIVPTLRFLLGEAGATPNETYLELNMLSPLLFQTLGLGFVLASFLRLTQVSRESGISEAAEERLKLASITTDIASRVSQRHSLNELLNTVVEEIRDNYPAIYHAQIFLIDDERRVARLAASTGEVGRELLRRRHGLEVGSASVIGRVTADGRPVIARAGAADSVHRRNELLPDTAVEVALPLRVNEQIIGALDLQSTSVDAFPQLELPIFQALADNIAIAIDNARLTEAMQMQLQQNERLVEELQLTVEQVERLNSQLTNKAWRDFLGDQQRAINLDYDPQQDQFEQADRATASLLEASAGGRLVQRLSPDGETLTVSLPVRVRGQVIGGLELELNARDITPEDLDMIAAVNERFSLAAENARLYEDAQKATLQEQRVNDIAARYQQVTSIDELLSITVAELSETLGARSGAIRLGRLETDAPEDDAETVSQNGDALR